MSYNIKKNDLDMADLVSIAIVTFLFALLVKFLICLGGWALICAIMGWGFEVPHALCIFIFSFMMYGVNTNVKRED